jgi:imidazolonepropionase-like amidohydrolase
MKMMATNPDKQYMFVDTYRLSCLATAAAHRAGVKVLTGTDYPNPYVIAGYSLHEELVHLTQQAGLLPHEALFASTRRAAEYHGGAENDGYVAAGGVADLLLLDGNPLDDIHHTRGIHTVLAGRQLIGP